MRNPKTIMGELQLVLYQKPFHYVPGNRSEVSRLRMSYQYVFQQTDPETDPWFKWNPLDNRRLKQSTYFSLFVKL